LPTTELSDRIFDLMQANASNNDTLVDGIASRAQAKGIVFNPLWARLRCMPHTVHLAAIKLLEAIGAISAAESKKATSRSGNYQDSATAPLGREHDDDAVGQDMPMSKKHPLSSKIPLEILFPVLISSGKLSVRFVLAPSASRHG